MKKFFIPAIIVVLSFGTIIMMRYHLKPAISNNKNIQRTEEQDRIDLAMQQDYDLTKDLRLNKVPRERLIHAMEIKNERVMQFGLQPNAPVTGISWNERGPNNIGGRTRAVMFDLNDAANGYKKVWAGSVGGGLWYTNDISAINPIWNKVNDLFDNIAVTSIVQNPLNKQEMYFGTGEGWYNGDAIQGLGIWKSSNGGSSWNRLLSTSPFKFVNDLLIDNNGNLFAALRDKNPFTDSSGIQKSSDGGATWKRAIGFNFSSATPGADLELAANGDIYASLGVINYPGSIYRSSYSINTINTGDENTWTNITPPVGSISRIELACAPSNSNVVYALMEGLYTTNCSFIQSYSSATNIWTNKTIPTIIDQGNNSNFTRGQAWYDLTASVDPNDSLSLYIGGVDALRSDNGGNTWTQMTTWSLFGAPAFTAAQNVHADHHAFIYSPGSSSRAISATDGGIAYTENANIVGSKPTFLNKNSGYNVTQFYATAMHPTNPNYFLAGAQDNGTQKYTSAGINSTTSASGGDGAFCHIDQNNPNIQITSYVYNNYFISTDGGSSFSSRNFNNNGSFINPTDYDDNSKKLYAGNLVNSFSNINTYLRWEDPATAGYSSSIVTVPQFGGYDVTNVTVSPLTPNRVFFGLTSGSIIRVDNANTGVNKTGITTANVLGGSITSIAIDPSNEDHMLATIGNYGSQLVLECKNATQASPVWTPSKGNLPDMPVRWAMFDPRNPDWALIATELGVWSTNDLNGAATDWQPTNSGLANVRVDMLQYRPGDRTIAAATHGRGLFTAIVPNITTPDINFVTPSSTAIEETNVTSGCRYYKDYTFQMMIANAPVGDATVTLNVQSSSTATLGNDFDLTTNGDFNSPSFMLVFPYGSTASKTITLRIYNDAEIESTELIKIGYTISGTTTAQRGTGFQTFTFAISDNDVGVVADGSGNYASGLPNTNATNSTPFRTDKLKHRLQSIYTAAELKAAGFLSGGNITALQLYVVSPNVYTFNAFNVSLANTSAPNLGYGFINDPFTQVYSGNYTTTAAGQFNAPTANNIPFSTPFVWDGVSNIVVQFCFDNGPNIGGTYYVQGNSSPLGTGVRSSTYSNYTNEPVAGCSLNAAYIDDNRARITFTASFPGTTIATALNTTRSEYFTGNSDQYFYAATGELLARLKNNGANNYGCTQIIIDRAGNGTSPFWNNVPANFLMNKTYRILPTTNNSSGPFQVTFYFTKAEVDGWVSATGQTFNNIQMIKVPGQVSSTTPANPEPGGSGTTQIITSTIVSLGTKYSLTATFSNGFSGFGFGIPGPFTPLPVTLLNFSGSLQGNHSLLDWTTSTEINSKQFEVERSYDGINFNNISIVKAAGNSSTNRNYSLMDIQVAAEINYYRLVMVNIDGQRKISNIIIIKNASARQDVHVINNPFKNNIDIRFEKIPAGKIRLQLTDMSGKKIAYNELNASTPFYSWNLSKLSLAHGIYIFSAEVEKIKYVIKVIKE